jgi:hypothetical protein
VSGGLKVCLEYLKFDRGEATESALAAPAVIGPFDPHDDGNAQLLTCRPALAVEHVELEE